MRYSKGKWKASYRDTWSLDYALSPIILAGLTRFHDVLEQRHKEGKTIGIPNDYMKNEEDWVTDSDVQDWLDDIKKMMYAFDPKSEPDIKDYDFRMDMVAVEGLEEQEGFFRPYTIVSTNQAETDRYDADMKVWQEKKQEGLNLFAQKYTDLWW